MMSWQVFVLGAGGAHRRLGWRLPSGEAAFRCGGVWGGMRHQVGCQEPAGAHWLSWPVRVARGAVAAREGFWRALLGVAYWWSGWETVAGGVRWLPGCRRSGAVATRAG